MRRDEERGQEKGGHRHALVYCIPPMICAVEPMVVWVTFGGV